MTQKNDDMSAENKTEKEIPAHEHIEEYGAGHIKARHGRVNGWLLAVYAVLCVWSLYYLFNYWGGLGPGLDY